VATVKNKDGATVFGRRISEKSIKKAVSVSVCFTFICFLSTLLLMATSNAPALDIIYETVSATATVGLSRNFTASLDTFGRIIIILTMYFWRVGPISLAVALGGKNESQNMIVEPMEEIHIG
jgi:trk system potassium uptake protein TrkH